MADSLPYAELINHYELYNRYRQMNMNGDQKLAWIRQNANADFLSNFELQPGVAPKGKNTVKKAFDTLMNDRSYSGFTDAFLRRELARQQEATAAATRAQEACTNIVTRTASERGITGDYEFFLRFRDPPGISAKQIKAVIRERASQKFLQDHRELEGLNDVARLKDLRQTMVTQEEFNQDWVNAQFDRWLAHQKEDDDKKAGAKRLEGERKRRENMTEAQVNELPQRRLVAAAGAGDIKGVERILAEKHEAWEPVSVAGADPRWLLGGDQSYAFMHLPQEADVPLLAAIDGDHVEMVTWLLDHGANANIDVEHRTTPLCHAAEHGNERLYDLLAANGGWPKWAAQHYEMIEPSDGGGCSSAGGYKSYSDYYASVLASAAWAGSEAIVRKVLAVTGSQSGDNDCDDVKWRAHAAQVAADRHPELTELIADWKA